MIIDCHTHLGRNEHIKATAKELVRSMDRAGIDRSLVFSGHINDCSNQWMMEEIAPFKDRLMGVASVNLTAITAQRGTTGVETGDMSICDMLETLRHGAVALKLYIGYEHFAPNSERVRHVLDLVKTYSDNRVIIFHTGDCLSSVTHAKLKYAQPLDIDDIAVDYPDFNFVIAHMGYPWHREAAEVCYKNANVYSDISGFVYGNFGLSDHAKFRKVLSSFMRISSTEKLLFGTDWPISDQKSYRDTVTGYMDEAISITALSQNVKRAFKLA